MDENDFDLIKKLEIERKRLSKKRKKRDKVTKEGKIEKMNRINLTINDNKKTTNFDN